MEIIIGGMSQGKLDYLLKEKGLELSDVCDGADMLLQEMPTQKVCNHFHLFIRRLLENGQDVDKVIEKLMEQRPDLYIICDEVGCGVVPMEAFERAYREKVGRVMCRLTGMAERVVRVQCGIGIVIA